jgi:hypothetical protein
MKPPSKFKTEFVEHFRYEISIKDLLELVPNDIPQKDVIIASNGEELQIFWSIQFPNDDYDKELIAYEAFLQKQHAKKLKKFEQLKKELDV